MKILIKDQSGTTQYTHDVHVPFGSCNSDKKSKSATPLRTPGISGLKSQNLKPPDLS